MSTAALELSDHSIEVFSKNLEVYAEICLKIRDKDAHLLPLTFNFAQRFVHEQLAKQYATEGRVRAIILKARQTGFSTYTAARFYRRLTMLPHQRGLVIAHEQKPAEVLFGMYDLFHSYLPDEMRPMVRAEKRTRELHYDNPSSKDRRNRPGLNSQISVDTANNLNIGRGSTLQMVHASEMGMWEKPEDAWLSLTQAVPRRNSEIIIESTAKGVGNFFHQMWLDAVEGANDYLPIFLPWFIHEEYRFRLSKDERDAIKATLSDTEIQMTTEGVSYQGVIHKISLEQLAWRRWAIKNNCLGDERLFKQEYPSTAEEAFLVSGNTFIEEDVLKNYADNCTDPVARGDLAAFGGGVIFRKSPSGYLRIWRRPGEYDRATEREPVYVIGADTASGRRVAKKEESISNPERGGRDFSVADVVDVANHRQVAQLHGRMAPEVFATHVNYLGKWFSTANRSGTRTPALLAVEKNHNSGESVLRMLQQDLRYPHLFRSRRINRRFNRPEDRMGWVTSVETRMPMLDGLASSMRDGTLAVPCRDTIRELMSFVRDDEGKPAAQEGAHDDRVIALAIAHEVGRHAFITKPKHYDEATLGRDKAGTSPSGMFSY